ncbi:MAG: cation transporter [Planctomycetaceae bacterium]|nr:cation transporter [Planctomycetaceae bacterium]
METSSKSAFPEHTRTIYRITLLGAICNAALVVLKFAAGIWGSSSVLIADAVHSLSDFVTDAAVIVGARYWERPADEEHPYGHAKLETIVTLFIGVVLSLAGLKLITGAVAALYEMTSEPEHVYTAPGIFAFAAALLSIVVKEFLYRITAQTGRRIRSSAVVANAWHHRSDALSSIPAAAAVGFCLIWGESYAFLDPAATILVGGMIFYAAWLIMYPTFGTLMDAGASREAVQKISELVQTVPGVENPHKIRTRNIGNGFDVDLHVRVCGSMTVTESHEMAHQIENVLKECGELAILDVIVHIEPIVNC